MYDFNNLRTAAADISARTFPDKTRRLIGLDQWFPKWVVSPPWERWETLGGPWSRNGRLGGGEAEMDGWGAIGEPVNNYISVVLLTLSDQIS